MTRRVILTILCLNILKQTSLTTLCRILPRLNEKVYPIFAKFLKNFPSIHPKFRNRNRLGWKSAQEIKTDLYLLELSWLFGILREFTKISNFDRKNTIFGFKLSKNIKNTQKKYFASFITIDSVLEFN